MACILTVGMQAGDLDESEKLWGSTPFEEESQQRLPSEDLFCESRESIFILYDNDPWNPGGVGTPNPEEDGDQSTGGATPIGTGIIPLLLMSGLYGFYLFVKRKRKIRPEVLNGQTKAPGAF